MDDLEAQLQAASSVRYRLIATDGVFSMDGTIANLRAICDLADRYHALVMVDECHAAGFLGKTGRGTPEYCGVEGRVDLITGTLGKALGGGSGGYTTGRPKMIDLLRQRSRPYLFSNSVTPSIVAASLQAIEIVIRSTELRDRLEELTQYFRQGLTERGFTIKPGNHPIVPVMIGDAALSQKVADRLLEKGYVVDFLPGCPGRDCSHPHPDVGSTHARGPGFCAAKLCGGAELGF
jgi:glycine C-acetyltransferase